MSLFHPPFNDTCEILRTSRNDYNDYVVDSVEESICLLREIRTVRRTSRGELRDSDGQIWFPADTNITVGDMIRAVNGKTYQLEEIIPAKGLRPIVQFLKFDMTISDVVFEEVS